ncbi:MAG: hypothetical protein IJ371_00850 [Clostridia bacterium]|nr:hypothetical protein [Clostridia bacterium]
MRTILDLIKELKFSCPIICGTEKFCGGRTKAALSQAEFFKTHTFILDSLTPREAQILRLRYGIDNGQLLTLEQVGKILNISCERVRQLEQNAFAKLRNKKRLEWLCDYTDETFDRSLLEEFVPNYKSLIRQDILRTIKDDALQVIQDISVDRLSIIYGSNERDVKKVRDILTKAGINTCGELIKYLQTVEVGIGDIGLTYKMHQVLVFSICDLIDKGDIKITSKEHLDIYVEHKTANARQVQKNMEKRSKYLADIINQERIKDDVKQQSLRFATQYPENVLIEHIGFSLQAYNCLKKAGVNTLEDLLNSADRIKDFWYIGPKTYQDIVNRLNELGISFEQNIIMLSQEQLVEMAINTPEKVLISNLNLTKRSYNALKLIGISTLADLIQYYNEHGSLKNIKRLGEKSQNEILAIMQELGVIHIEYEEGYNK